MNNVVAHIPRGNRWFAFYVPLFLLIWCGGCAMSMESTGGSTWVFGLSRGSTGVRDFGERHIVVREETQKAPLELRFAPYGLSLCLAELRCVEERVLDEDARALFVPRRDFGIQLGGGTQPWRFGLARYRVPRSPAGVRARVDTIRGVSLRLGHMDSSLIVGSSRACITELDGGDHDVLIDCVVTRRYPEVKITQPQQRRLIP